MCSPWSIFYWRVMYRHWGDVHIGSDSSRCACPFCNLPWTLGNQQEGLSKEARVAGFLILAISLSKYSEIDDILKYNTRRSDDHDKYLCATASERGYSQENAIKRCQLTLCTAIMNIALSRAWGPNVAYNGSMCTRWIGSNEQLLHYSSSVFPYKTRTVHILDPKRNRRQRPCKNRLDKTQCLFRIGYCTFPRSSQTFLGAVLLLANARLIRTNDVQVYFADSLMGYQVHNVMYSKTSCFIRSRCPWSGLIFVPWELGLTGNRAGSKFLFSSAFLEVPHSHP